MKIKIYVSILFMLMCTVNLTAQLKTEKYRNGVIAKQYSLDKNGNYHGTFTWWTNTGKLIEKANYSHGDLHGSYVSFFDNGVPSEVSTYYQGQLTSQKRYKYFGTKRYLMYSATWSNNGLLLTEGYRSYSDYTGVGDWHDTAGKLSNGYWRSTSYREHIEVYTGNDTAYVWFDKAKTRFKGKHLVGQSNYIMEYNEDGELLKSPELTLKWQQEKAEKDSIDASERRQIKEKQLRVEKAKQDSILQVKADYQNQLLVIQHTDSLYTINLNRFANGNECKFFVFLCDYIKKNKNFDAKLHNMIADVLEISKDASEIKQLMIYIDYSKCFIVVMSKSRYTDIRNRSYFYYANDEVRINLCKNIPGNYVKFERYNRQANIDMMIPNDITHMHECQMKLNTILQYCNDNAIVIK